MGSMGEALGLVDDHVDYVCEAEHEGHCMFCDGGLRACTVCDGLEGAMPTQCPGVRMTWRQADDVHRGRLDFRAGRWWVGLTSRYAPGWVTTWEGLAEVLPTVPGGQWLDWFVKLAERAPLSSQGYVEAATVALEDRE
jgi:hypothetical protein